MSDSDIEKWNTLGIDYWENRTKRQKWAHEHILYPEIQRLLSLFGVKQFSKLLDYGCGDGSLLRFFQDHGLHFESYGYDKSCTLIQIAKSNCPIASFIDSLPNLTFDVICLNMVIQDVFDPIALLIELRTALKDSGIVIFSIPHPVFSLIESQHLTTSRRIKDPSNQKDVYRYRFEETEEVFWNDTSTTSTNLYNRTIATYAGYFRSCDYRIVDITEPSPIVQGRCDMELYDMNKIVPKFMFMVVCKQ